MATIDHKKLSLVIMQASAEHKLNLSKLAKATNVQASELYKIIHYLKIPCLRDYANLCEALGVSLDFFIIKQFKTDNNASEQSSSNTD